MRDKVTYCWTAFPAVFANTALELLLRQWTRTATGAAKPLDCRLMRRGISPDPNRLGQTVGTEPLAAAMAPTIGNAVRATGDTNRVLVGVQDGTLRSLDRGRMERNGG